MNNNIQDPLQRAKTLWQPRDGLPGNLMRAMTVGTLLGAMHALLVLLSVLVMMAFQQPNGIASIWTDGMGMEMLLAAMLLVVKSACYGAVIGLLAMSILWALRFSLAHRSQSAAGALGAIAGAAAWALVALLANLLSTAARENLLALFTFDWGTIAYGLLLYLSPLALAIWAGRRLAQGMVDANDR